MQISICMMVKDEEKNIKRCLDSVLPILQNIDSELIVIDTGSKDSTVEVVKEYTENIFFHEWENDFSGMRNKSISYAKGEWILYLNPDTIVEPNTLSPLLQKGNTEPSWKLTGIK